MKNPWKSCHPLFRVHRVYGIQNDRLDLTINKFLTFLKTQHHIKRYLQICETKEKRKKIFKSLSNKWGTTGVYMNKLQGQESHKLIIWEYMASFTHALSRVILL